MQSIDIASRAHDTIRAFNPSDLVHHIAILIMMIIISTCQWFRWSTSENIIMLELIVFNCTKTIISILYILISPYNELLILNAICVLVIVCICIVRIQNFLLLINNNIILLNNLSRILNSSLVLILHLIESITLYTVNV
jgi:hypothetical protein